MKRLLALSLLVFSFFLLRADAQTGQRVALVIGNGSYVDAGVLANPVNDSEDIAEKLKSLGFQVIEGRDLAKRDLETKIGEFSDALEGAEAGLFYYAGHGLQVDGRNFIVPVDARLNEPAKLKLEAVPMDDIMDIMEQQTKTSIVILDACRNNPFARSLARKATTRSAVVAEGLAQFDSGRGSFIAFSTSPGNVAMDGSGRNSPFAAALLKHMDQPGQSINDLMIAVRRDVIKDTKEFQRPWEQGSLTERFELVPAAVSAAPKAEPETKVAALTPPEDEAKAAIKDLITGNYLKPDPARMEERLRSLYGESVASYGRQMDFAELLAIKTKWFSQWESWKLNMLPDTLKISMLDDSSARAEFDLRYKYMPKDKGTSPIAGTVHVFLDLVNTDGRWVVEMENAQ